MKVAFRVDASRDIGSGHIMRCIALAECMQKAGIDVCFISADLDGNLNEYVKTTGIEVCVLPRADGKSSTRLPEDSSCSDRLGVSSDIDAKQTLEVLSSCEGQVDWLVVDHYELDFQWEERVASRAKKLLVIDDLHNRRHSCDVILDQNLPADNGKRYSKWLNESAFALIGPSYALLRSEFSKWREQSSIRERGLQRLLIMFGGFDMTGETLKALHGLANMTPGIETDVVISAHNFSKPEIKKLVAGLHNVDLHIQPTNVAQLMLNADFSLGAGGITLWERCAMRLPSASTVVAENQRVQLGYAFEAGITLDAGDAKTTDESSYRGVLEAIRQNPMRLRNVSIACGQIVDGLGPQRVLQHLIAELIQVRPAENEDCMHVLMWRNSPQIRQLSLNKEIIPEEIHREWFQRTLKSHNRVLLIGELGYQQIGVVRFDLENHAALVSIYLNPEYLGQGLGSKLLDSAEHYLLSHHPRIRQVIAHVLKENIRSSNMFIRAGYEYSGEKLIKSLNCAQGRQ